MKFKFSFAFLGAFAFVAVLHAQVSFTYQVVDATCSSNGSIQVTATGAVGTLNYQLSGPCLQLPLIQQSPNFNNLPPCQYTLTVTDGGNGSSASETVTVGGSYQNPDLGLVCGACAVEAIVTGGAAPLSFAISTAGLGGPYQPNTPSDNPIFTNVQSGSSYWVKVTDACGNFSVEMCQTGGDVVTNFTYELDTSGQLIVNQVVGGSGSYLYTLTSSNGMTSNTTGVFPASTWGCNMTMSVSDGCTSFTKNVTVRPKILSICTNFADGTASLGTVLNGIPPFTFNYISPDNIVTSSPTSSLSGLPINASYYLFQVVDACGNKSEAVYKQKKYPLFLQTPIDCDETSISMYTPDGGCGGGYDADSWPFTVTCLSCTPVVIGQVDTNGVSLEFNGITPGNWELAIEDGCNDQMNCHDSLVLVLEPLCDSVKAYLVDRFYCDNGAVSDRPMNTSNGTYKFFDSNGTLLETNSTGIFLVPDSGNYKVTLNLPICGNFSETINLGYWKAVNPVMKTYLSNAVVGGKCRPVYQLVIDPTEGPFYLTGGPNNISVLIDEDDLTSNCLNYSVNGLLPGEYELAEVDHCQTKHLHLPAPVYDLQAEPFGNCPGSGTVTATGAKNLQGWQAWGIANNANITWPNSITDNYSLDAVGPVNSQSGSPYTFTNISAGAHFVFLYTLGAKCPVDTAFVVVPEADTISFDVSSGILCDGANTTSFNFEFLSGKPPFVIEQVDCNNPSVVIATHALQDSTLSISGFTIGDYCFRLIDSCVTSADYQFSVQNFQDDIEFFFNCDNTITLKVDSLNASYEWLDEAGNQIGNTHKITVPNPGADASFTALVDIGECIVDRTILVPATEIVPLVSIEGKSKLCQNETVTLSALVSNGTQLLWDDGSTSPTINTSTSGTYSVVATNSLGCTATDDFTLTMDIPLVDIQVLSGGSGFGLKCFQDSNGILLATPTAGIAPFIFEWSNLEQTPQIENLKAGHYSVILTDSIGCKDTALVTLTEPDLFEPFFDYYSPKCFGTDDGFINIPGWNGGAGDVKVKMMGSVPQAVPINFDNLPGGDYSVEVFDANGCTVDTIFTLDPPAELFMELGENLTIELGDSIYLNPQISFEPVDSFLWRTNNSLPINELAAWTMPLQSSYFQLTVWDDEGCPVQDRIDVRVIKDPNIYVPNSFSPNSDGINDFFTVYAKTSAVKQIRSFQIYDRFGERVFARENFNPNYDQMGWDGRFEQQPMNPGVFIWKAEIEFIDGRIEQLYGDVTLMN